MDDSKKNWFSRILIIFLCVFISILIVISFLFSEVKYVISSGIIICFAMLIILVLSEVFDNFSIANIITLKRKLKSTTEELSDAKRENTVLRSQIINNMSVISKQNSTQNLFVGEEFKKIFGVEKADVQNNDRYETNNCEISSDDKEEKDLEVRKRLKFYRGFEKYAMEKILKEFNVDKNKVFQNIQFKEGMIGIDPIMEKNVYFDGYYTDIDCECFIQVQPRVGSFLHSNFVLYYALNKIYFYRKTTNKKAKLLLIVPVVDEGLTNSKTSSQEELDKVKNMFMPALNNDLLEIKVINVDKNLYEYIVNEKL